jgi:hypothetical protein
LYFLISLHTRIAEVFSLHFPEAANTLPEILAQHCSSAGPTEQAVASGGRPANGPWLVRRSIYLSFRPLYVSNEGLHTVMDMDMLDADVLPARVTEAAKDLNLHRMARSSRAAA